MLSATPVTYATRIMSLSQTRHCCPTRISLCQLRSLLKRSCHTRSYILCSKPSISQVLAHSAPDCPWLHLHCAGWNFIFAEQKLWRVVSLVVTIIPIVVLPFTLIVALVIIVKYGSDLDGFLANLTLFFSMLASPRLVLLGLALALVRHLPPTAYIAVNWTQVYPTSYKSIRVSVVTGPRTSPF